MNILAVGDVVGDSGTNMLVERLDDLKKQYEINFCVVNGENACTNNGITRKKAEMLLDAGADVVTLGNHSFRQKEAESLLLHNSRVIRPINYPEGTPGRGMAVLEKNGKKIAVISAMGMIYMDDMDCPFRAVERAVKGCGADIILVDFHAEATSEKAAMAYYLDGRVSAVWGTHTHVQTSDARILPRGTGFITDLGMTGPAESVIGIKPEQSIGKFLGDVPRRYDCASGPAKLEGALFEIDTETGACLRAEAVRYT